MFDRYAVLLVVRRLLGNNNIPQHHDTKVLASPFSQLEKLVPYWSGIFTTRGPGEVSVSASRIIVCDRSADNFKELVQVCLTHLTTHDRDNHKFDSVVIP